MAYNISSRDRHYNLRAAEENGQRESDHFLNESADRKHARRTTDPETEQFFENYYSTRRVCGQILLFVVLFLLGAFAGFFSHEAAFEQGSQPPCDSASGNRDYKTDLERLIAFHRTVTGNVSSDRISADAGYFASARNSDKDEQVADETAVRFKSYGFNDVEIVPYEITLAYPVPGHPSSVQLVDPEDRVLFSRVFNYGPEAAAASSSSSQAPPMQSAGSSGGTSNGQAVAMENSKPGSENGKAQEMALPMFYAHSAEGSAEGELVYAHYGEREDFEKVEKMGIAVSGKIVLLRYGKNRLHEKVELAEKFGANGILFYLDPADKHLYTKDWYITSQNMADPHSPGFPAKPEYLSGASTNRLPSIPAQPISEEDAHQLMLNMTGKAAPDEWQGAMNLTYYIGRKSQKAVPWMVRLKVVNQKTRKTLYNVIGTIEGLDSAGGRDRFILVGSHRGNMDNYNGTAMMMEIARNLGIIRKLNWKPKRTIKFCSWGSVHGVLGSVEWAEEHKFKLTQKAVVYIDMDMMVQGGYMPRVEATASLSPVITTSATLTPDPTSRRENATVYGSWMEKLGLSRETRYVHSLGPSSDYLLFPHQLGITTLNMQYVAYNYSQTTETYVPPMFSDEKFVYHKLMAQLTAQAILSLCDATTLQFDYRYTSTLIQEYLETLREQCAEDPQLYDQLVAASDNFDQKATSFEIDVTLTGEIHDNAIKLKMVNDILMLLERSFLLPGATDSSYRHLLYSDRIHDTFPAIAEMQTGDENGWNCTAAADQLRDIQAAIDAASDMLTPDSGNWWWGQ